MSRFRAIYDEANALYHRKNRCYDAAVTFEQARQVARADLLAREAAEAGVWAAISWFNAGHPLKAYNLLLEILRTAEDDLEPIDKWRVKKYVFDISHAYDPELGRLQQRLETLVRFQREYPQLPLADVHELTGDLLTSQGQWQAALTEYERAWVEYNDEGYLKYGKADSAAWCNLRLGNLAAARRWCDLLGKTETNRPNSRIRWYTLQANLALYTGDYTQAAAHAIEAETKTEQVQYDAGGPCKIRVRTLLLQSDLGDPARPTHPARFRLRQRFRGKPDVVDVYVRALLMTDYHLACVRYSLGVAPVDDDWYQQPQAVPASLPPDFDPSNFCQRVALAHRALHRALKQAQYVDGCFQCNWRQNEVQQRQNRLEELVHATQYLAGDHPCLK